MILLRSADEFRECRKSNDAVRECAVAFQPCVFRCGAVPLYVDRRSQDEFREWPECRDDDA